MILAVGLDIVEVERLSKVMARQSRFAGRVFTPRERDDCMKRSRPDRSFAARFAAKEAAMKALGTGWGRGVGWRDVEIAGGVGDSPQLFFHGGARSKLEALGATKALLSLTHEGKMAAAVVILVSG